MKSEISKGSVKRLLHDDLPKGKIIFCDTNFIIDALFAPDLSRKVELQHMASGKPLTEEEEAEYYRCKFVEERHEVSVKFIERLIKEKMNLAFSSILFTEVYFVSTYTELDKVYKDRKKSVDALKEDPTILAGHTQSILKKWDLFMDLLSKFDKRIYPINPAEPKIIEEVLRLRTNYRLTPNDSFHLGTMLAGKQSDIVVFDNAIKNVALEEGINAWWNIH